MFFHIFSHVLFLKLRQSLSTSQTSMTCSFTAVSLDFYVPWFCAHIQVHRKWSFVNAAYVLWHDNKLHCMYPNISIKRKITFLQPSFTSRTSSPRTSSPCAPPLWHRISFRWQQIFYHFMLFTPFCIHSPLVFKDFLGGLWEG